MTPTSPKIDRRDVEEFSVEVRTLLARYVPGGWPPDPRRRDAGEALIRVFGHFCGTVIDRLNRAPYKNLLAFLDLQGIAVRPTQPARVPLTFQLAAQHRGDAKVPAQTQVAAAPEKGEDAPVVFETERELIVTSAKLAFVGTKDAGMDRYSDYSSVLNGSVEDGVPIFRGAEPIEHSLYFKVDLPISQAALRELRLNFQLEPPQSPANRPLAQWEIWSGTTVQVLPPTRDDTNGLTRSGDVAFQNLPLLPVAEVGGKTGHWLRLRLLSPLGSGPDMVSPANLPSLQGVQVIAEFARQGLRPDGGLINKTPIDLTKDFFPFGERPKFGDSLYIAASEPFACAGSMVTVRFALANAEGGPTDTPIPPVHGHAVKLLWELWDGQVWLELGISESVRDIANASGFADTTRSLTRSGTVTFRVPRSGELLAIGAVKSRWLRCTIVAGNYGIEAHFEKAAAGGFVFTPPSFTPPCVHSLAVDYTLVWTTPPAALIARNDFTFVPLEIQSGGTPLFRPASNGGAALYFGFLVEDRLPHRSMSIYLSVRDPERQGTVFELSGPPPVTDWEYWNGKSWKRWTVVDNTSGFTRSELVRFLAPRDFAVKPEFGQPLRWLRARVRDRLPYEPRIRRVILNTTMAAQATTLPPEILGTSNGTAGQKFATTRFPVLEGQQLEIREPVTPPAREQTAILLDEGEDAIRAAEPPDGRTGEVWVRWHEVPNFRGSASLDRHYVFERVKGEVTFGDGLNGRIPPPLDQNIRMALYQTGGGAVGNRKANTITQLKSAVPYMDKVTNFESASGGAEAESYDSLLRRGAHQIRHRFRAVAAKDYEDLALLASPEVARALGVPMRDLSKDQDGRVPRPGVVSLVIAPVAAELGQAPAPASIGPQPSHELFSRVRQYLDDHRPTEADLVIVGPDYVSIKVETDIIVATDEGASDVELAVTREILRFLHPITGKWDGRGWHFGELPRRSEFFALIEAVPGVDHVRELKITRTESRPRALATRHFLIWPAEPRVTASLEM
jgi:predicted phage baseplate assembly protein